MMLTLGMLTLLLLLNHWGHSTVQATNDHARVLEAPVNVTVPLGRTSPAEFTCSSIGRIDWHITYNGNSYSPSQLTGVDAFDRSRTGENSTLRIDVTTAKYNNTGVECNPSNTQSSDLSDRVYLTIAGPPLAPVPTFEIINTTAIILTWEKPFSVKTFDVTSYTVRVTNASNPDEIPLKSVNIPVNNRTSQQSSEMEGSPHVTRYVMNNDGFITQGSCHELLFNVTASNAAGESSGGTINGGFPITPGPFGTPFVYEHYVPSNGELVPRININFTLPLICQFQLANYTVTVLNEDTVVSVYGPWTYELRTATDQDSRYVDIPLDQVFEYNTRYTVEVVVKTIAGNTSSLFSFIIQPLSGESSTQQPLANVTAYNVGLNHVTATVTHTALIGGVVAGILSIILILVIIITVMCALIIRRHKMKRQRVNIQTTEISLARACENMESNPIYSGDSHLYDQIVDVQMIKSLPQEKQQHTDCAETNQYAELSAFRRTTTSTGASNKPLLSLAGEYKLYSQESFKQDDEYTLMSPVGTIRSCAQKDNVEQLVTGAANGQTVASLASDGENSSDNCGTSKDSGADKQSSHGYQNKLFELKEQQDERYAKMT